MANTASGGYLCHILYLQTRLKRSGPIEHYKAIFSSTGLLSDSANKTHLFHDGMNLTHLLTSPEFLQIHFILYSVHSPETFHILPY